jgi:hypothetical protein
MGLTLFWVHDTAEGRRRTHALANGMVSLLAKTLPLARVPGVGALLEEALGLAKLARNPGGDGE